MLTAQEALKLMGKQDVDRPDVDAELPKYDAAVRKACAEGLRTVMCKYSYASNPAASLFGALLARRLNKLGYTTSFNVVLVGGSWTLEFMVRW